MKKVKLQDYQIFIDDLSEISTQNKIVINTINAHSYVVANKDASFKNALIKSNILLPDGEGIVKLVKLLNGIKIRKIAGADIHEFLLNKANQNKSRCFYLGSSEETLEKIKSKLEKRFPNIDFGFYSPPFKSEFSRSDNELMIKKVNDFKPDILFVGMTAPKQEKWVIQHKDNLDSKIMVSIGAVFDFVAETKKRAPSWIIDLKLEWFYRALTSWRLTKRYLYSNPIFLAEMTKLYFQKISASRNS